MTLAANPLTLLFLLVCGHYLVDFSIQNEFVARNKNPGAKSGIFGRSANKELKIWAHCMTAHSFHHGLAVYLITQSLLLGVLETLTHWITDYCKCRNFYNFHADQFIHLGFKLVWFLIIINKLL